MILLYTQIGMAAIIIIGMVGVFYPEKIQSIELKASEVLTFGIPNPFVSFLQTDQYLTMVRLFGAMTLLAAAVAEYLLFVKT